MTNVTPRVSVATRDEPNVTISTRGQRGVGVTTRDRYRLNLTSGGIGGVGPQGPQGPQGPPGIEIEGDWIRLLGQVPVVPDDLFTLERPPGTPYVPQMGDAWWDGNGTLWVFGDDDFWWLEIGAGSGSTGTQGPQGAPGAAGPQGAQGAMGRGLEGIQGTLSSTAELPLTAELGDAFIIGSDLWVYR